LLSKPNHPDGLRRCTTFYAAGVLIHLYLYWLKLIHRQDNPDNLGLVRNCNGYILAMLYLQEQPEAQLVLFQRSSSVSKYISYPDRWSSLLRTNGQDAFPRVRPAITLANGQLNYGEVVPLSHLGDVVIICLYSLRLCKFSRLGWRSHYVRLYPYIYP
jgi:hypothetical protein